LPENGAIALRRSVGVPVVNRDRSPAQARVVARHRRERMRADPLVGIEDRDRHAVEWPTSRGVGSRPGLHATAWSEALV
jgi:hypothetical protein